MIDWNALPDGIVADKAQAAAKRTMEYYRRQGIDPGRDFIDFSMDLEACVIGGYNLDFDRLMSFSDQDFIHDMIGIARHVCRDTGQLLDGFVPRCGEVKYEPDPDEQFEAECESNQAAANERDYR